MARLSIAKATPVEEKSVISSKEVDRFFNKARRYTDLKPEQPLSIGQDQRDLLQAELIRV